MAELAPITTGLSHVFKARVSLDAVQRNVEVSREHGPLLGRLHSLLIDVQAYLREKHCLQGPELRGHGEEWLKASFLVSNDLKTIDAKMAELEKLLNPSSNESWALRLPRAQEYCGALETLCTHLQKNFNDLLEFDFRDGVSQGNEKRIRDAQSLTAQVDETNARVSQGNLHFISDPQNLANQVGNLQVTPVRGFDEVYQLYQNLAQLLRDPVRRLTAIEDMMASDDANVSLVAFRTKVRDAAACSRVFGQASARSAFESPDVESEYEAQRQKIEVLRPRVAAFLRKLERGKIASHLSREDRKEVAVLVRELWQPWKLESGILECDIGPRNLPVILGSGGYGTVSRGTLRCRESTFKVALKSMHAHISWNDQQNDFLREVSLRGRLRHDAIVQFYGVWWPDDEECRDSSDDREAGEDTENEEERKDNHQDHVRTTPMLVMEYMDGDVANLIRKGEISDEVDLVRIFFDITDALSYVHEMGVVHNDLKPENVLATARDGRLAGRAKLTDFGVSVQRQGTVSTRTAHSRRRTIVLGTPAFMAPEVLCHRANDAAARKRTGSGLREVDVASAESQMAPSPASDTYSAGLTMCTLAQAHSSKAGREVSPPEVLRGKEHELAVRARERTLVPEVRDWVCDVFEKDSYLSSMKPIVLSCVEEDPKCRPSMSVVREKIDNILNQLDSRQDGCRFENATRRIAGRDPPAPAHPVDGPPVHSGASGAVGRTDGCCFAVLPHAAWEIVGKDADTPAHQVQSRRVPPDPVDAGTMSANDRRRGRRSEVATSAVPSRDIHARAQPVNGPAVSAREVRTTGRTDGSRPEVEVRGVATNDVSAPAQTVYNASVNAGKSHDLGSDFATRQVIEVPSREAEDHELQRALELSRLSYAIELSSREAKDREKQSARSYSRTRSRTFYDYPPLLFSGGYEAQDRQMQVAPGYLRTRPRTFDNHPQVYFSSGDDAQDRQMQFAPGHHRTRSRTLGNYPQVCFSSGDDAQDLEMHFARGYYGARSRTVNDHPHVYFSNGDEAQDLEIEFAQFSSSRGDEAQYLEVQFALSYNRTRSRTFSEYPPSSFSSDYGLRRW